MAGFLKRLHWRYWLIGALFGLMVPYLLTLTQFDQMIRYGLVYGVGLTIVAGVIGTVVKRQRVTPFLLWLFPVAFLIGTLLTSPPDTASFALVYLCVSYLSYGFSRQ